MNIISNEFNFLKPIYHRNLIRLGHENDGGYVLPEKQVKESDGLVSFGYGYDCSFENDYIKNTGNSILIYDHTCDYLELIKKLLKYLKRFLLFRKKFHDVKFHYNNLIVHHNFVSSKKVNFFKKRIVAKEEMKNDTSISSVIKNVKFQKAILKCDIEGTEYDILDEIIKYNEIFNCILVEFHKINDNVKNFKDNVNKLLEHYYIVHLHGNNHDPLIENINIPSTLEITFVKKMFIDKKVFIHKFPIENLDKPNNPNLKDHSFEFKE